LAIGLVALLAACDGGSSTVVGGGTGTVTAALDGTWNVSQAGESAPGKGSNLVIGNDSVTGAIIDPDEGMNVDSCTITKYRTEINLKFAGNALSGTFTSIRQSTNNCVDNSSQPINVTGSRTNAGSGMDGDWEVTVGDTRAFIVSITGQSAKVWDKEDKAAGHDPTMTAAVASGNGTTAGKREFGFAAQRQ
jgi:hypothetical protein